MHLITKLPPTKYTRLIKLFFAILSVGRIVGESAALLFTAGSAKSLPKSLSGLFGKIFNSGGTLTIQLYLSATSEGDFKTAFGIAVVLLVIVFFINCLTRYVSSAKKENE